MVTKVIPGVEVRYVSNICKHFFNDNFGEFNHMHSHSDTIRTLESICKDLDDAIEHMETSRFHFGVALREAHLKEKQRVQAETVTTSEPTSSPNKPLNRSTHRSHDDGLLQSKTPSVSGAV